MRDGAMICDTDGAATAVTVFAVAVLMSAARVVMVFNIVAL